MSLLGSNMLTQMQNYDRDLPFVFRLIGTRSEDGIESQLVVTSSPFGYRRMAELIRPERETPCAAILYVHWYEPESPDSNRSQFVSEAKEMAKRGAACLLIETMWSDPDFFLKRIQEDDPQNSIQQVVDIRRAMDFLLAQPHVDRDRFAFIGHDFGGMYGVLAGSLDRRPTHYVIMAATPRFPDWYLYAPKLEGEVREGFIRQMAGIDPISHVGNLSPAPILFQFATDDFHVPRDRAEEFFAAAGEPKELRWYQAGHGLNDEATRERMAWLTNALLLTRQ
jgi:dienelactone hydrolase